jgi:nitrogen fixation protein NifX
MGYRVAIAAQPERMVTQHFGRATVFQIFERAQGEWVFVESRASDPTCAPEGEASESHDSLLAYAADLIADCDAVLAARIGPGAVQRLADREFETYAMHALIEDALAALGKELDARPATQSGAAAAAKPGSETTTTASTGRPATDRQE